MAHAQNELLATDIDAYLEAARAQVDAALPHLRQRRRRQVHPHRAAALRLEAGLRGPPRGPRGRLEEGRHPGRRPRLRPARRRPGRRARAGHHHRRRLPLLLHRAAQVHRRRHARPRAVHPQHGHRRLHRRPGGDPRRRPQGRADPDPPPLLPGVAARDPPRGAGGEQARPRRLLPARSSTTSRPTTGPSPRRSASSDIVCVPLSALRGDNVTEPSANTPWYDGPDAHRVPRERSRSSDDLDARPVPDARCSGSTGPNLDFRGFSGEIVGGTVHPGDRVRVRALGARVRRRRASSPPTATSTRPWPASRSRSASPTRSTSRAATCIAAATSPAGRGRPVRVPPGVDGRGGHAPRPPVPAQARHPHRHRDRRPPQVQGQRQHPRAHRGPHPRAQRDRRVQRQPRPADPVRPLRREPRHGRVHPRRPVHQRHRGRRACSTSPCAGPTTCTGRPSRSTRTARAALNGQRPAAAVVHRALRLRQVHHRQHRRAEAPRAGPPHLPARRRQRPPRAQQGPRLHRRRPGREHPPGGRGRPGSWSTRGSSCWPRSSRRSAPSAAWRGTCSARASSSRSSSTPASRSPRAATARASTPRPAAASWRTSPASTRPTRSPSSPKSTSTPAAPISAEEAADQVIEHLRQAGILSPDSP